MKKGIYLTIITIITVICIIGGSLYHLVNFFSYFPFHSTGTSTNGTEESIDSASIKQLEGFDNIWADVDVSDILITRGEDYAIDYQATKNIAPKYEVKNGTLTIKQTIRHRRFGDYGTHNRSCKITITIPKGATLSSIELDTNVGDISIDSIVADELITDSNVGDTKIQQCSIASIETDSSVGDTKITDCSFSDLDSDNDVGDIIVKSAQDLSDYEMELDTNIGDVTINKRSHKRNYEQSGAAGSITLDNSTGDISLSY